ncbi:putative sulfate/molybdate transporter [Desulfatitalea alkaliphila]|uniref:Sulfate/molybdate transporter n=1 Tax=Desulfatitalea alkaliphila TaxID=2929485 RepID=A0AA41UJI4_9BACT|nr:putative sulfate/molybdate transporter [Desulfatitalea alkaliphila]MCJ8499411.1 putative sulfate/molybdate transporter [Desulfatitalea alkaliphila]
MDQRMETASTEKAAHNPPFLFNRLELAGSLGDLGTILPLAIGMILINGLHPLGLFLAVGLFYIGCGLYFRVTVPVEPMKVIGAYAVATGIGAAQIQAATLWTFLVLLLIGGTGLITVIGRAIPRPVIRGVQLSTGVLLVTQGVKLMLGTSPFQAMHGAGEPYLAIQAMGPVPLGLIIGAALGAATLMLLDNKRLPAAIVIVGAGMAIGLLFGTREGLAQMRPGLYWPSLLPFGLPSVSDLTFALMVLVLPQMPMTVGNAVVANADLSLQYFPRDGRRVTYRALSLSMALGNLLSFCLGGMPMCHGAGGLASRYRFGARSGGSNLIIGVLFILLALLLGPHLMGIIHLLPMAALGVLLVFAGAQLSLTLLDMNTRKELFVPILVVGITLASNLAAGFIAGTLAAYALRSDKLSV